MGWNDKDKKKAGKVDKTFGMKNKKGKAVQNMARAAQGSNAAQDAKAFKAQKEAAKRAEIEAMNALLFVEAKKKSELRKKKEEPKPKVEEEEEEPKELELAIEFRKKKLTTRTPVTLERLQEWLQKKKDAKAAAERSKLTKAQEALQRGKKLKGLTGRDLFSADASLFVDDEEAAAEAFEEREGRSASESEGEEDEEQGDGAGASKAPPADSDLVLGERVRAKYLGGRRWYMGTVRGINADGSAHIEYEDGDEEEAVRRDFIEPLDREAEPPATAVGSSGARAGSSSAADAGLAEATEAIDLDGVDQSLFLNEDLPSEGELDGFEG